MQNAFIVRCFYTGGHLSHDRSGSLRRHSTFATEQVVQSFAFDVLHHEEEHTVRALAEVRHVDDVRVTNRRSGTRFALETCNRFAFLEIFVAQNVGTDSLYRYASGDEVLIASEIDLAHRAATEPFLEQVAGVE